MLRASLGTMMFARQSVRSGGGPPCGLPRRMRVSPDCAYVYKWSGCCSESELDKKKNTVPTGLPRNVTRNPAKYTIQRRRGMGARTDSTKAVDFVVNDDEKKTVSHQTLEIPSRQRRRGAVGYTDQCEVKPGRRGQQGAREKGEGGVG